MSEYKTLHFSIEGDFITNLAREKEIKPMKTVTFGMIWQVYGKQTIEVPDDLDTTNEENVRDYIRDNWADIPLPTDSDYVAESDELDELVPIEVSN